MKKVILVLTIWGLNTIGQGWAAEAPTARMTHASHDGWNRTSEPVRGGKDPLARNTMKGVGPGLPQNQPRLLSTRSPQFQIKRAAAAASSHYALRLNRTVSRLESQPKLVEAGGRIAPKPIIGHGSAPASVGHLTAATLKHNTAELNGSTIKRRF
jgi:hypothetical protein